MKPHDNLKDIRPLVNLILECDYMLPLESGILSNEIFLESVMTKTKVLQSFAKRYFPLSLLSESIISTTDLSYFSESFTRDFKRKFSGEVFDRTTK